MALPPDSTTLRGVDILGPTLASILHDLVLADRDVDGLLFGRVAQRLVSTVSDQEEAASSQETTATITGFCCSGRLFSFYDPSGSVDPPQLARVAGGGVGEGGRDPVLGWFVARRDTPLRPSMRETAVTASLRGVSSAVPGAPPQDWPLLFALFDAFQSPSQSTHTHEYRVFQCQKRATWRFEPCSVNIVNIGPFFRGQFDSFAPMAPFPPLPLYPRGLDSPRGGFPSHSRTFSDSSGGGEDSDGRDEYLQDQATLDRQAEGYSVEKLRNLVGREAPPQMLEIETLYRAMLGRLEKLAKDTCRASEAVHKQVEKNAAFRSAARSGQSTPTG